MPGIYRLKGTVKHYDWGGTRFIPSLLKTDNPDNLPFAEYWMGAHPQDNCTIEMQGHQRELLKEFLQKNPVFLGEQVQQRFGHLPYLFKVLDVQRMLSIQVHPSKAEAEKEFARENAAGIPLDSIRRNYKDDNHKPELMVALGDFWLLHGFKPTGELTDILINVFGLGDLLPVFNKSGYEGLYRYVMEMPQEQVNQILQPLLDKLPGIYAEKEPDKYVEDYWVMKAAQQFPHHGKIDRGIFSIYFFNLVHLKKGEGIFQPAGLPHAYLEGQNVEIMASSDNVLRGGLTNKHIDVPELLKHVRCEPTYVRVLRGEGIASAEKIYKTDVPDFGLGVFDLIPGDTLSFSPVTAEVVLLTEGDAVLHSGDRSLKLEMGHPSALIFPGKEVGLSSENGGVVFRATVNL